MNLNYKDNNIKIKTVRSALSISSAGIAIRFIGLLSTVFLARILEPSAFGTVALALVIVNISNQFSGFGMGRAVVQSVDDIEEVAFHAFLVSFVLGAILSSLVFFNAGYFASLLGHIEIKLILQYISLVIILANLYLVPSSLLRKELMFGKISIISIISELMHIFVAIVLAKLGYGVWSLVHALLVRHVIYLLLVWGICPGWDWLLPKPVQINLFKKLFRFGIPYTANGILAFFNKCFNDIIVGRILGVAALGFYNKAFYFAQLPITTVNMVVNNVLFSSYSKIQSDKIRLSKAYLDSLGFVTLVTIPMCMGIFVTASDAVPAIIGEKWSPMIIPLKISCLVALIRIVSQSTGSLYLALGKPGLNTKISMIQCIVIIAAIYKAIQYNISGVACAALGTYCIGLIYNMYLLSKELPGVVSKIPKAIYPSFLASIIMTLFLFLIKKPLGGIFESKSILIVLMQIFLGVFLYAGTIFYVKRTLFLDVGRLIGGSLKN